MGNYIPKLVIEDGQEFILLSNVFAHEMTINYAKKHNYNIKFVCGNYTCATEILCKIQEAGYDLKFVRRIDRGDLPSTANLEIEMFDTVYCYLKEDE